MERYMKIKDLAVEHSYYCSNTNYYSLKETYHYATWDDFEERKRQIEVEEWTPEEDDLYTAGQLALAGATYAIPTFCRDDYGGYVYSTDVPIMFPFSPEWWKPTPDNRIRELAKAGALIAAEIDRLQRLK